MKKQLLFIFLLFGVVIISLSQEHPKFLYANIKDNIGAIYNANIINLNTKQGTFSNEKGEFRILAKKNDSLKISFIGYKSIVFIVKPANFGILKNTITLIKETYVLDEVVLKRHNLSGTLTSDMKQLPKNISIEKSKGAFDFSMIDFNKKVISKIDGIIRSKAPDMQRQTDPTAKFTGASAGFSAGTDKYAAEKRRLRKEIKFKENFPKKLLSEFGEKFFFDELKIPKEKYHVFLEYCNPSGIEELYKNGKVLEMLKTLQKESINYLKVINSPE